ncbi:APC family permease [Alkaliphilus hydrothermalis]|uniref:APA family basic amino acid/polyamine antiporter n=1 Tax=Alkaliphilus hydrothermalis TaxID=1482730 RepID=A0ABS2NR65_9FIRM|nr:amino acid permease [Alkaliphilus hydrothermalis]MBM7615450.1 APA family basic amino acid/polyamine antiporter [Alkaliphilus hydrothermalis]
MSAILRENVTEKKAVKNPLSNQETKSLKKEIGLADAVTMVVGVVIGSGIFFKSSSVFSNASTPLLGILAWILGGVVTIASALTITEIATAIPKTGGIFAYLKELYGEKWAFLFGWVQSIIYVPGVTAALSIVFVTQATFFIPLTEVQQKVLAIFMIFLIISINIISTKLGSKVQVVSTIAKLIPIIIIIGFGLINGNAGAVSAVAAAGKSTTGIAGFGAAILGTLWAYDGWVGVGNMAGELKNPGKDLPRSIILGLSMIIGIYVLINLAIINIIPVHQVMASGTPASDAAIVLFGNGGAALIAGGIMVSIFGAMNGYLMTGVRVPFAMAQDRLFPFANTLGQVNKKFETPLASFIMVGILAVLYVLSGSFEILTTLAMFVVWLFFIMTVSGIFILRKKFNHLPRTYKVPLYPVVPLVGIAGGIYIIASTLITDTSNALFGIVITMVGFPVYLVIKKIYRA